MDSVTDGFFQFAPINRIVTGTYKMALNINQGNQMHQPTSIDDISSSSGRRKLTRLSSIEHNISQRSGQINSSQNLLNPGNGSGNFSYNQGQGGNSQPRIETEVFESDDDETSPEKPDRIQEESEDESDSDTEVEPEEAVPIKEEVVQVEKIEEAEPKMDQKKKNNLLSMITDD